MQIVRESINFTRGIDPKTAMGIGLFANIAQNLFEEDFKHEYIENAGSRGNILELEISPTRFIIKFYSNKLVDPITGKKVIKKEYATRLIETLGLKDMFLWTDYNGHNYWVIFKIKPEFRQTFKRGHYMPHL